MENSIQLFNKLDWLPIDDIIRTRKLVMIYKITKGKCPAYFNGYVTYLKQTHNYSTRASMNDIVIPKCRNNSGLRTLFACGMPLITEPQVRSKLLNICFLMNLSVIMYLKNTLTLLKRTF